MKIFDCFPFHNELDMLELRLKEHWNYVDYFVIVEANETHKGHPKPYYFLENRNRFKDYLDKIIHVRVDDLPQQPVSPYTQESFCYNRDHFQRNRIIDGLSKADPDDIIMVSDVDEIVRPQTWQNIKQNNYDLWALKLPLFYFKFNFQFYEKKFPEYYTLCNIAIHAKHKYKGHEQRCLRDLIMQNACSFNQPVPDVFKKINIVEHGGWHFTFIGDEDFVKHKIISDCTVGQISQKDKLQQLIDRKQIIVDIEQNVRDNVCLSPNNSMRRVALDDYFPQSILSNVDRWKKYLILEGIETAPNVLVNF